MNIVERLKWTWVNILLLIFPQLIFNFRTTWTSPNPHFMEKRAQSLCNLGYRDGCLFALLVTFLHLVPDSNDLWRRLSLSRYCGFHPILDRIFQFNFKSTYLCDDQQGFQGCLYWYSQENILLLLYRKRLPLPLLLWWFGPWTWVHWQF